MAALAVAEALPLPKMQRARGEGRVIAGVRDGQTEIRSLYQEGCAKIRLPHTHSDALQAVLMNTAGGLTGGDHIRWTATAEAGAKLVITTPACERVYRSLGSDAEVENRLVAGHGAHIDWLPQETILFDGSRLDRRLDVELADGATLTAVEAVLLGREAMGEAARNARLRDNWRIRRNGRLIHAEATTLSADPRQRDGLSLLDGALAFATVLHIAPDAERRLDAVRALLPDSGGASVIGERLTVRLLREAMGEAARNAHLRDNWRIRRNGRLIHAEATTLSADPRQRDGLSLLDGALAFATVLHISPDAERRLDAVRALLPDSGGASVIGERLTVRLLAESGIVLRRSLSPIIALLSSAGSTPRLWTL